MISLHALEREKSDILKIIAISTMLIDHIGFAFFPEESMYRMIGRIAYPIFAYQIAMGYYHTSNRKKYLYRLLFYAGVSQIPYMLLFQSTQLNVLVTLSIGFIIIHLCEKQKYLWMTIVIILSVLSERSILIPDFSYGWFGVGVVVLFYIFRERIFLCFFLQGVLMAIYIAGGIVPYQYIGILSVFFCLFIPFDRIPIQINKSVFYWFYPLHMMVIWLLQFVFKIYKI